MAIAIYALGKGLQLLGVYNKPNDVFGVGLYFYCRLLVVNWLKRLLRSRYTWGSFPLSNHTKRLKNWYPRLLCLTVGI